MQRECFRYLCRTRFNGLDCTRNQSQYTVVSFYRCTLRYGQKSLSDQSKASACQRYTYMDREPKSKLSWLQICQASIDTTEKEKQRSTLLVSYRKLQCLIISIDLCKIKKRQAWLIGALLLLSLSLSLLVGLGYSKCQKRPILCNRCLPRVSTLLLILPWLSLNYSLIYMVFVFVLVATVAFESKVQLVILNY